MAIQQEGSMIVLGNILQGVGQLLAVVCSLYTWIVIASIVFSFVSPDPMNSVVRFVRSVTEPCYYRIRKWAPFVYVGNMDFSPMIVLIVVYLFKNIIALSLIEYGMRIK